jgi:capsular polysaccharide transport system permease protein
MYIEIPNEITPTKLEGSLSDGAIPPPLIPKSPLRNGKEQVATSGGGHIRTIVALMLREMSSRYGRTPGGYVWAILEPLGMILMLAFGFSLLMRSPPLGNSFLLFYATGYLPFSLFLRGSRTIMNALTFSRNLLRYPAVTWFDAVMARAILNILTDLLVAYILLAGILMIVDTKTIIDFVPILLSFALASLLAIGVGLVNCVAIGFFPIWATVWSIFTRPLFIASGVIWLFRDLPQFAQDILWWNPLTHIVSIARTGYFPTYEPQYVSVFYTLTVGLVLCAFGLLILRRYQLWILNRR